MRKSVKINNSTYRNRISGYFFIASKHIDKAVPRKKASDFRVVNISRRVDEFYYIYIHGVCYVRTFGGENEFTTL